MIFFGILVFALLGWSDSSSAANSPIILYTDITNGPNTGGEDNNGAYLSIFGKNFGNDINAVSVTVGGGAVARKIYLGSSLGRPDVQQLSVQLGPNAQTGAIKVRVGGVDSNTDHTFTVRPGDFYFMSKTGSNSTGVVNDVTHPYRTANYVINRSSFGAGDFLVIRGGNYDLTSGEEDITYGGTYRWVTIPGKSGSLNNEITLYGYPGEVPVIDWGAGEDQGPSGLKGSNEDYWNIANIAFDVRDHGASSLEFGFYNGTNSNDYFRVVNVRHRGGMFANKTGGVNSWSLNRCGNIKIYGCDTGNQSSKALPTLASHVWYISHDYSNGDIAWNYIHDNSYGRGVLQMAGDPWGGLNLGGGTTYSWTLSSQGTNEYYVRMADGSNPNFGRPDRVNLGGMSGARQMEIGSLPADSWGYGNNDSLGFDTIYVRMHDNVDPDTELAGGVIYYSNVTWGDNVNVKVHDNIFKNLPQSPILFGGGSNEIFVYNNLFINGCTSCSQGSGTGLMALRGYGAGYGKYYLYNNTIYDGPTWGSMLEMKFDLSVYPESITLLNNIIVTGHSTCAWATVPAPGTVVTSDNNIWYGSTAQTNRPWWGANDRVVDPQFYDPSSGDFHLQSASPAVNTGSSLVSSVVNHDFDTLPRPQGSGWDIGAFEYASGYNPPAPDTTPPSAPSGLNVT